jgi:hypothetical protein
MKLKIREIPGAYVGKHMEVVGPLGQRVWPPLDQSRPYRTMDGVEIKLGCARDECVGFVAGYEYGTK